MSINALLNSLTQNQLITTAEAGQLRGIASSGPFLRSVTQIYENKAKTYLEACLPTVQRAVTNKGTAVEKIMQTAWRCFLEIGKLAVLPLVKDVLETSSPDLAASLGLTIATPAGDSIKAEAERVFICYAARYRLFHTVDQEALSAVCQEAQKDGVSDFPFYLYSAMQVEDILSRTLKSCLKDIEEQKHPQLLNTFVLANEMSIRESTQNTLFYLGTVLKSCALSQELQDRYFLHLQTDKKQFDFARLISEGFMHALKGDGTLFDRLKRNASCLTSEKVHQICLPALSLMEIKISVDKDAWNKSVEAIKDARSKIKNDGEDYERRIEEAKRKAQADINAWRASIPDRGFNIYATTGPMHM